MDSQEWMRLGQTLERLNHDHPECVALVRFIALTGCRRGETEQLMWPMIEGNIAVLPDSTSGPKVILLSKPVLALLAGVERFD